MPREKPAFIVYGVYKFVHPVESVLVKLYLSKSKAEEHAKEENERNVIFRFDVRKEEVWQ